MIDITLKALRARQDAGEVFAKPEELLVQVGSGCCQFRCICGSVVTFAPNSMSYERLPVLWFQPGIARATHSCGATYWKRGVGYQQGWTAKDPVKAVIR